MEIMVYLFLLLGLIFNTIGVLGLLIFPDIYTRIHGSSTCATTAVLSVFIAAALNAGISAVSTKVFVITVFYLLTGPVSSHIIAQFAWNSGVTPWRYRGERKGEE